MIVFIAALFLRPTLNSGEEENDVNGMPMFRD